MEVLVAWAGSFSQCENDAYATSFMDADTERPGPGAEPPSQPTTTKLYLTFDDGPREQTGLIVDVLQSNNVNGTFFIYGEMAYPSRHQHVIGAYNNGNLIANHSESHWHSQSDYQNHTPAQYAQDFNDCDDTIAGINGMPSQQYTSARMPGQNMWRIAGRLTVNDQSYAIDDTNGVHNAGYTIYGWDMEWAYTSVGGKRVCGETVDQVLNEVKGKIENPAGCKTSGKIVLLSHDDQFRNETISGTVYNESAKLDSFIKQIKGWIGTQYEIEFKKINDY